MPLRVVFLGSDTIALPLLEWLENEGKAVAEVVAVYTQPDRPTGRGQQVTANGIKLWAQQRALPVLQPERLSATTATELAAFRPDLALVMAYGHILKDDVIGTPRWGTLNLHTSRLPQYRGASPIQTAIANGERETAVTLMRIVRALDAGPIADLETVGIDPLDTAADVEARLAQACVPLVARCLPELAAGRLNFVEQDHAAATYCRRLNKSDGVIDFSASARSIAARINGLFPWPACSVDAGGVAVKIGLADAVADASPAAPGTVLGSDAHGVVVSTGNGVVRFRRLQRPGGRMLPASEFVRGFPMPAGLQLASRPMPELVSSEPFR